MCWWSTSRNIDIDIGIESELRKQEFEQEFVKNFS